MATDPEVLELFDDIEVMLPKAIAFDGVVVRSVGTKYANENDIFSGVGAAKVGGRWNPKGLVAVYGSLDIMTATREVYQNFIDAGFSLSSIQPRVTAGATVSLSRVLDLTKQATASRLGFDLKDLLEEDWLAIQNDGDESWTQAIGRGCAERGFEGLLVPSSCDPKNKNLVVFPDSMDASSSIRIIGRSSLPPHPPTWPAK